MLEVEKEQKFHTDKNSCPTLSTEKEEEYKKIASEYRKQYAQLSEEGKDYLKAKYGDLDRMSEEEFNALDLHDFEKDLKHEKHLDYWNFYTRRFEQ